MVNRSIAWQHFTAIPGDDSAECNICQKVIKMGASRLLLHFTLNLNYWDVCEIPTFENLKLNLSRCTTGLLNHTKRQHPAEWADGSSGQQIVGQRRAFGRGGTTRNPNKRSKAWRSLGFVNFLLRAVVTVSDSLNQVFH